MSETKRLPRPRRPQSYWLAALLTMIFCCTPCGIVALIFAYQVSFTVPYSSLLIGIISWWSTHTRTHEHTHTHTHTRTHEHTHAHTHAHTLKLFSVLQTDDLYDSKDYAGSVKMSKRALRWIKASVLFNIIFIGFFIVYCIALGYTVQTMLNNIMDNPDV